jgi:hypothetical protein
MRTGLVSRADSLPKRSICRGGRHALPVRTLASYGAYHIRLAAVTLADIGTRSWSLDRDCLTRRGMIGNVLDSNCYLLSPGRGNWAETILMNWRKRRWSLSGLLYLMKTQTKLVPVGTRLVTFPSLNSRNVTPDPGGQHADWVGSWARFFTDNLTKQMSGRAVYVFQSEF